MKWKKILGLSFLILVLILFFSVNGYSDENEEEGVYGEYIELTGTVNYLLFGLSAMILPWKYLYKFVLKRSDKDSSLWKLFKHLNSVIKRSHIIVGVGAFIIISFHAYTTIDKWNILLPVGLLLIGLYILTGILFYMKSLSSRLRKILYRIHSSIIYLVFTIVLLYIGHLLAD